MYCSTGKLPQAGAFSSGLSFEVGGESKDMMGLKLVCVLFS